MELLSGDKATDCYTFIFSPRDLQFFQGHFDIPCVKVSHLEDFKIKMTYFIQKDHQDTLQISRSQEMDLASYVFLEKEMLFPFWKSGLKLAILESKLRITLDKSDFVSLPHSYFILAAYPIDDDGSCKISSLPLKEWMWNKRHSARSFSINLNDFSECEIYCIQVSLKQESNDENNKSLVIRDTAFFKTPVLYERQLLLQGKWNATMMIQAHSFRNEVSLWFSVMDPAKHVFHNFEIFLFKVLENNCNEGFVYKSDVFELEQEEKETVQTFHDVHAGRYCIKVRPIDEFCENRSNVCIVLNSYIVTVNDITVIQEMPWAETSTESDQKSIIMILVPAFLIAVLLFSGLWTFIYFKRKHAKLNLNPGISESKETLAPLVRKNTCPFVLCLDDNETRTRVIATKNILQDCAGIYLELLEPNLTAILGPGRYQCWDHSRIIVVETNRVITLQNRRQNLDVDIPEDSMENHFLNELTSLTSNMSSLKDYHRFFVVQFKDILPTEGKIASLVPNERYILPDQMAQFILDLLDEPVDSLSLSKKVDDALAKYWSF